MSEKPRVWFVTGCSTGIGRALAEILLDIGESVVVTARNLDQVRDLESKAPDRILVRSLDITDSRVVNRVVDEAVSRFGRIDVLVNNAGSAVVGAFEEIEVADIEATIATNVLGTLNVIRAVLPHMRERRNGHILSMTSVGGMRGRQGYTIYATTKFGLEGFHEALRRETEDLGIKVTLIEPGQTKTNFRFRGTKLADRMIDDYREVLGPLRALVHQGYPPSAGEPSDVARIVVALVRSDRPPPMRLAIGADSVKAIREKLTEALHDLDSWEALSVSTGVSSDMMK